MLAAAAGLDGPGQEELPGLLQARVGAEGGEALPGGRGEGEPLQMGACGAPAGGDAGNLMGGASVGEGLDDLRPFSADAFAGALLGIEA